MKHKKNENLNLGSIETLHMTSSTKTYLYNLDPHPLKRHFYIVKLGFTGVYIIYLISAQNIDCGYSLEATIYVLSRNMKKISDFLSETFTFWW